MWTRLSNRHTPENPQGSTPEFFDQTNNLKLQLLQQEVTKEPKLTIDQCIVLIQSSIQDVSPLSLGQDLPKSHPLVQAMIPKKLRNWINDDDDIYRKRKEHFDLLCYLCWLRKSYNHNGVELTNTSNSYSEKFAVHFLAHHLYYNNTTVLFKGHEVLTHDWHRASWIYHQDWIKDWEKIARKNTPTISLRRNQWQENQIDQHTNSNSSPYQLRDSDSYFDIYADEVAHAVQYQEKSPLLSRRQERERASTYRQGNQAYQEQYASDQETLESNAHRIKKYQYLDTVLDSETTSERLSTLEPEDKAIGLIRRLLVSYINNAFTLPASHTYAQYYTWLDITSQDSSYNKILASMQDKGLWGSHAVYLSPTSYQNLVPQWFRIEAFTEALNAITKEEK